MGRFLFSTVAGATLFLAAQSTVADELNVLSLESLKPSLERLLPTFQKTTGHVVKVNYGNSSTLPKRFSAKEPFDVALASTPLIARLTKEGIVAPAPKVDIARVAIGVGIKKGAPKPDIRTTAAFRKTLLSTASLSHASEGPSGVYLNALLKRLGIEAEMKPKLRPVAGGPLVMGPVAKGEAELGIITIPFIVAKPNAELVGPLPDELQEYVVYAAAVSTTTKAEGAARKLISHITAPTAASAYRADGLDPLGR